MLWQTERRASCGRSPVVEGSPLCRDSRAPPLQPCVGIAARSSPIMRRDSRPRPSSGANAPRFRSSFPILSAPSFHALYARACPRAQRVEWKRRRGGSRVLFSAQISIQRTNVYLGHRALCPPANFFEIRHPASALGKRVWKSSNAAHSGVMVMRTMPAIMVRSCFSQASACSGPK